MRATTKQQRIIDFILDGRGDITKKEAVALIGGCYYCNASKHVGDVLSRMVKRGMLVRVKTGTYKIGLRTRLLSDPYHVGPNQIGIFEKEVSNA